MNHLLVSIITLFLLCLILYPIYHKYKIVKLVNPKPVPKPLSL